MKKMFEYDLVRWLHDAVSELPYHVVVRCTITLPGVSLDVYYKSERVVLISTDGSSENGAE